MIALQQADKVSEHVKERSRRMWVRSHGPNAFIVTPKEKAKARRLVRLAVTEAGTITIECIDKDTGEICPANLHSRLCSHANAALNRLYSTIKRRRKYQQS